MCPTPATYPGTNVRSGHHRPAAGGRGGGTASLTRTGMCSTHSEGSALAIEWLPSSLQSLAECQPDAPWLCVFSLPPSACSRWNSTGGSPSEQRFPRCLLRNQPTGPHRWCRGGPSSLRTSSGQNPSVGRDSVTANPVALTPFSSQSSTKNPPHVPGKVRPERPRPLTLSDDHITPRPHLL